MKRVFPALILSIMVLSGCSAGTGSLEFKNSSVTTQQTQGKIKVVTSFYPLYEIAKQVGGEYVDLRNLVPPGAEPHDYELTPKDVADVYNSQILVVNGAGLEPWLDGLLPDFQKQTQLHVVDESLQFQNLIDPHIWLDPSQYMQEVTGFEKTIETVDPQHKDYYSSNAQNFNVQLANLDQKFKDRLQNCASRDFVTNHAAFGYISRRYNLNMISIAGISPDAEPSSKTLASLVDLIRQKNIHYILTESLVSPKIAETLAQETGVKTMVLNPLEGLSDVDMARGENYISVMEENLKTLQIALECK